MGIASALVFVLIAAASTWAVMSYLDRQYVSLHDGCAPRKPNHTITVKNNDAVVSSDVILRCDTLSVINLDDTSRMMAFGVHDNHTSYDGVTEKVLNKGESFTVTLVQAGEFIVHDHDNDTVQAKFHVQ